MEISDKEIHAIFKKWADRFDLGGWYVKWHRESLEGHWASTSIEPEYKKAYVSLDVQGHPSLKKLDDTIKHEMIHLFHAPFNAVFEVINEVVSEREWKMIDKMSNQACEMFVKQFEDTLEHVRWK